MIDLTERARTAISELCKNDAQGRSLRIFVQHKGCNGLTFGFGMDEPLQVDSAVLDGDAEILITTALGTLIRGSTLDYQGPEDEEQPLPENFELQLLDPSRFQGKFFKHNKGGTIDWDLL